MYLDDLDSEYFTEPINDRFMFVHRESDGRDNIADEDGRIVFDEWADAMYEDSEGHVVAELGGEDFPFFVSQLPFLSAESRFRGDSEESLVGTFGCDAEFIALAAQRHDRWVADMVAEGWLLPEDREGRIRKGVEAMSPRRAVQRGEEVLVADRVRNMYGNPIQFYYHDRLLELSSVVLTGRGVIISAAAADGSPVEIPFGELHADIQEALATAIAPTVQLSDRLHPWKSLNAVQRKSILLEAIRQHLQLVEMVKKGEWATLTQEHERMFRMGRLWEFLSGKVLLALQITRPEIEVYPNHEVYVKAQKELLGDTLAGLTREQQEALYKSRLGESPRDVVREAVGMTPEEVRLVQLAELMRLPAGKMGHFELLALRQEFDMTLLEVRAQGRKVPEECVARLKERSDVMLKESLKELREWKARQSLPLVVRMFRRQEKPYVYPVPPKEVLKDREVVEYIDGKRKDLDMRTKPLLVALFKYELLKRIYDGLVKQLAMKDTLKEKMVQAQEALRQEPPAKGMMRLSELRLDCIQGDMMRIVPSMSPGLVGAAMKIAAVVTAPDNPRSINPPEKHPLVQGSDRRASLVERDREVMRITFSGPTPEIKAAPSAGLKLTKN